MKGPNQYEGQNLYGQTSDSYTNALGMADAQAGMGADLGQQGMDWMGQAASGYDQAAGGYRPTNVTAGQLSDTNLQPYMNPFQQQVTDATMNELRHQEDINRNAVGDASMASGAWGGDRTGVEYANNHDNFTRQRAGILSQLNTANFNNAQQMATGDINRRFSADQGNQGMNQAMNQFGISGKANLGSSALTNGMSLADPARLAALSQQGYNYADTIAKNNLQAGTLQQQNIQSLIDAAKLSWEQFQNKPLQGLAAITGSTQIPSGGSTTSKSNPGILGILGSGLAGLGALMP